MPEPLFELFERVLDELSVADSKVITSDDFRINKDPSPLLERLMKILKATNADDVIPCAVDRLGLHFAGKGAKLPFDYDKNTGIFMAVDREFISFVNSMKAIRSIGTRSRFFECSVAERLKLRATGTLHRVGFPRDKKKTKAQFNQYLRALGFDHPVSLGKEKDGGFDILWMLPIGTVPHRPIVSVQCKNSEFSINDADLSVAAGKRSFGQNRRLQPSVHVPCVLFNDYLHPRAVTEKAVEFVPLGLSDLAALDNVATLECI